MEIFLSYASEDRDLADRIRLALISQGHVVFFDKESLPGAGDYRSRIRAAVERCDLLIFLISENSIAARSYCLTELKYARKKWAHPKGHVLPVNIGGIAIDLVPAYLKAVTILEPEGDVPAEVVSVVEDLEHDTPDDFDQRNRIRRYIFAGFAIFGVIAVTGVYLAYRPSDEAPLSKPTPSASIPESSPSSDSTKLCKVTSALSDVPAVLEIQNVSSHTVRVTWRSFEGQDVQFVNLSTGQRVELKTFIDHGWCIWDAQDGSLIDQFVVRQQRQKATIQ